MTGPKALKPEYRLDSVEALRQHYKSPHEVVVLKTVDRLDDQCRALIAASPFAVLATGAETGLDCSPKGDQPGFVHVLDDHTLLFPDRPGNNRIDGLTNIVQDPRVGLLFFLPGVNEVLRINGLAAISIDPDLLEPLVQDGKPPRSVIVVSVQEVFIHCSRAVKTAALWDPQRHVKTDDLPGLMEVFESHVAYSRAKLEQKATETPLG